MLQIKKWGIHILPCVCDVHTVGHNAQLCLGQIFSLRVRHNFWWQAGWRRNAAKRKFGVVNFGNGMKHSWVINCWNQRLFLHSFFLFSVLPDLPIIGQFMDPEGGRPRGLKADGGKAIHQHGVLTQASATWGNRGTHQRAKRD